MLMHKYTRLFLTEHRKVETGVQITEEGQALVNVKEGSETVVRPSTGAAGEHFAGVSMTRFTPPTTMPWVGEGKVPASLSLELPRLPLAGQILVRVAGDVATIVSGAPADETEVQLVGQILTFHEDVTNAGYLVQMQYEPTVTEARQQVGDFAVGGISAAYQGVTGIIMRGELATTFYDGAADFSSAITVKLGPDGRFTTEGQGTELTNVLVISAPSAENSALVLRVNV